MVATSPLVSVIIPTYNHAYFLGDALESVVAQRFADWEAIVVDDGSEDDPSSIVAQIGDGRTRLIRQVNQGLAAARNAGLQVSAAPYVAFLDADDMWEDGFLAHGLDALRRDAQAIGVYTRIAYVDVGGCRLPEIGGHTYPTSIFRSRLAEGCWFPPSSVMVRRAAIERVGPFDTTLSSHEDWDMWLRLSHVGWMVGLDEVLVRYRVSANSMSTNVEKMNRGRLEAVHKHLGSDLNSATVRDAYAHANRLAAFAYFYRGDATRGWQQIRAAAALGENLLTSVDTYYEIACAALPRGARSEAHLLDLAERRSFLEDGIAGLAGDFSPHILERARGAAYLAMAMLADKGGRWQEARHLLWAAYRKDPRLMRDLSLWRRAVKVHLPPGIARLLGHQPSSTTVRI